MICIGDLNPTGLTIVVVIGVYIANVPPRFLWFHFIFLLYSCGLCSDS